MSMNPLRRMGNDSDPRRAWLAYAQLGRAIARYDDPVAPSVAEMRQLLATLVLAHGGGDELPPACRDAVQRCVREHAPLTLAPSESVALTDLLVRWAVLAARSSM